tara:strand:- start:5 stop:625 length:621 start_codon:yes stop_codon:yes gene_type:complete
MIDYLGDQTKYNAVYELPTDNLKQIQSEVLEWVKHNTNFLNDKTSQEFWMKIDYKNLAKASPSIIKYFQKIRMPIKEITVGVLTEAMTEGFILHHGAPPMNFKINFPILNTEDIYTEWYDIPPEGLKKLPEYTNPYSGDQCYDLSSLHDTVDKLYKLRIRYNMHKCPIILNSYLPHRVMPGPQAKYPRIMLATMPIKDPFDLMQLS